MTALFAPLIANNKPYIYINKKVYFPILFDYDELSKKDLRKE
jgi:ABC-type microcin C transport system permease subunit YejE